MTAFSDVMIAEDLICETTTLGRGLIRSSAASIADSWYQETQSGKRLLFDAIHQILNFWARLWQDLQTDVIATPATCSWDSELRQMPIFSEKNFDNAGLMEPRRVRGCILSSVHHSRREVEAQPTNHNHAASHQ
jgi:hypothetical protein